MHPQCHPELVEGTLRKTVPEYHTPNDIEREFLRVVTYGYAELQAQVEYCELREYDPTGWWQVRVSGGPRLEGIQMCDGPTLSGEQPPFIEIIFWLADGYLDEIEVVLYGEDVPDIATHFLETAKTHKITYRTS